VLLRCGAFAPERLREDDMEQWSEKVAGRLAKQHLDDVQKSRGRRSVSPWGEAPVQEEMRERHTDGN